MSCYLSHPLNRLDVPDRTPPSAVVTDARVGCRWGFSLAFADTSHSVFVLRVNPAQLSVFHQALNQKSQNI